MELTEAAIAAIAGVTAAAEDAGLAVRERVARAERTVIGDQGDADEIAAELKSCSENRCAAATSS